MIPLLLAALIQAQPAAPAAAPTPTPPPAPEVVFALVAKTSAFAADSGRTALRATATKPAQVPGIDDRGYFVEFQWTDKAGAAHTGVAVMAHGTVREVPWLVRGDGEWGLVQVMEDKTVPAVVDELKRTRIAANEAVAVGDIRTIISGEMVFMGLTNGAYGDIRCLKRPADCITGVPAEQMLEDAFFVAEKKGYRRKFHGGARVDSPKAKGSPSPFVKTFAYTAVPIVPGETGVRGFCGDHTGRICVTTDGSDPPVTGGSCATPCTELKK